MQNDVFASASQRSNLLLDKYEIASSSKKTRDSQRHLWIFWTAPFSWRKQQPINKITFAMI